MSAAPAYTPQVSVIVVNWNTRDLLERCLTAALENIGPVSVELIVVDNASSDDSMAMMRERFPKARLIGNTENVGFARANNQGVVMARGRYLLLLNSDAFLTPGALEALVSLADAQPRAGLVGSQLRNADGSFQASHTPFPTLWREFLILTGLGRALFGRQFPSRGPDDGRGPQLADYVEGACMLIRPQAYAEAGGLDENYFMYAEEVDLCLSLRRLGWEVWYHPAACVIHLGGASSRLRRPEREGDLYISRVRLFRKHYGSLPAQLLKWLIYSTTMPKAVAHGLLHCLSRGRLGRPVVSLTHLAAKLRDA
jgi:hypothetical protein